jgi:hypothetical protein
MTYDVRVPDGKDWITRVHFCEEWIKKTWANIQPARIGSDTWDYAVDFQMGFMIYRFKDPQKATLFKLAWGAL